MLELYVSDAASEEKFPVEVRPASQHDFAETSSCGRTRRSACLLHLERSLMAE